MEAKHAKNTVRLLSLSLSNIYLYKGKKESDFLAAQKLCENKKVAVIYPTANAITPSSELTRHELPEILIFIDASWKQALGIWQRTPWLQTLPQWQFTMETPSQYRIRHSSKQYSLSTLEAVAHTLDHYYHVDTKDLLLLLHKFQSYWPQ
jgi:DTW domain-containing protein YfiP